MPLLYYNQAGLAKMWEVSAERVSQMRRLDDFPEPDAWLLGNRKGEARPLWLEETVNPWRVAQLEKSWR